VKGSGLEGDFLGGWSYGVFAGDFAKKWCLKGGFLNDENVAHRQAQQRATLGLLFCFGMS
jgi:hypothetical protein